MSYDPSRRLPPRQERSPYATPEEAWPAYRGADGDRGHGQHGADRHSVAPGGYPGAPGYQDPYPRAGDAGGLGYRRVWARQAGTAEDFGGSPGRPARDGYRATAGDHAAGRTGYAGAGYYGAGYYGTAFNGTGDNGSGYGGTRIGDRARTDQDEYLDRRASRSRTSGSGLIAPDTSGEQRWLASRSKDAGLDRGRAGLVIGAVTGLLAAAAAIGAATLAAAFVRPQASPVIAVGDIFVDRTPAALKNLAAEHFGKNDRTVLLLGMYVMIAVAAMAVGCLARRNPAVGVAGIAVFGLFGAFAAITRPGSRVSDIVPSVVGGVAGIAAFLWLARAAAPVVPLRHDHRSGRRRE
jgi:hypothetical protein